MLCPGSFQAMHAHGIKPSVITYNNVLRSLSAAAAADLNKEVSQLEVAFEVRIVVDDIRW
jgi:hypothetical protein